MATYHERHTMFNAVELARYTDTPNRMARITRLRDAESLACQWIGSMATTEVQALIDAVHVLAFVQRARMFAT